MVKDKEVTETDSDDKDNTDMAKKKKLLKQIQMTISIYNSDINRN